VDDKHIFKREAAQEQFEQCEKWMVG